MKKAAFLLTTILITLSSFPFAAAASDLMIPTATQRCATNEDCSLVTNSCADNCAFVPVNKQNIQTLQAAYQQRCGKAMEQNPQCNMNPPLAPACINSRCTVDYPYENNAGAKDYQPGAYPVPEQAVPSKVPASVAPANDRNGYTAYEIPDQNDVREGSLGQIKIYVPQSAPVSGGNYIPIGPATPAAAEPVKAAPTPTPVAPKPAATTAAPVTAPAPAATAPATTAPQPQPAMPAPVAPAVAKPAPAIIDAPPMPKPIAPADEATTEATQPAPAPAAVAVPAPAPVPTATTTPSTAATPANPIPSSANPALPEPRVPDSEQLLRGVSPDTGNVNAPIPPSEFKSQTFVPPAGATIEVSPEDPGAKPPEGTTLVPPAPRGPDEEPLTIIQPAP